MTFTRNHYQMNNYCPSLKAQTGAVLLLFMLILVTGASYSLLNQLNSATNLHTRQQVTSRVLAEAKQVLIGYALTYPENNAGFGPGYLPCPDRNNNGFINAGPCALSTSTTIGRFPWRSLGVREMVDSSGARLWYVLSDNYRNNPKINNSGGYMNSDNAGQLTLDGVGDIVAIIIAPGEPVGNQNRVPLETTIANEIANYLEGENADIGGAYDVDFATSDGGVFNDMVITITRQELMTVIEKRVLGDVKGMINNYQTLHNAFPWLSPFADPSTSVFRGVPTTTIQGHIPFHWVNDPDSIVVGTGNNIAGRNPFQSSVGWIWHTDIGTATGTFTGTVTADCLRNVDCSDGTFPQLTQVTTPPVDCTWSNKETVDCTSAGWILMSSISCDLGCGNYTCTREYNVNIQQYSGVTTINNPTNLTTRSRDVSLNGSLPVQNTAVRIRDRYTGSDISNFCFGTNTISIGSGTINFVVSTTGTLETTGIQYDIDIDNEELPEWFVANNWHHLIYLTYASGEFLPGDTTVGQDCVSLATPCITITNLNGSVTNVRSAVLSAGVTLAGQDRATTPDEADYFDEVENSDLDDMFEKKIITATYNDQTRIISTAP